MKLGVSRGGGPGCGRAAAANAPVGYGRCEYKPGRWPTASCALRAADTAQNSVAAGPFLLPRLRYYVAHEPLWDPVVAALPGAI